MIAVAAGPLGTPAALEAPAAALSGDGTQEMIPKDWLGETVSVERAEAEHPGIADDRIRRFPEAARPFGFENPQWEALKARMCAGDVLRTFASPPESWRHLAGRAGIALVRNGKVVALLLTVVN